MKQDEKKETRQLGSLLLAWYDRCRRSLPWRDDPSAYHVWISEIMLQQTRVEAVKGYYARFLERFPDIRALAEADEDTCLKMWEGLGYYSRARNLQKAARQVMEEYGGQMPCTSRELIRLPGIGPYTAAAIASIAFGEKIPAVDGNLLRVFSRLSLYEEEIKTPAAASAAKAWFLDRMPDDRPGDFNQAFMDLGAGICTPGGAPSCGECPLRDHCRAAVQDRAGELPVMPVKKARGIEKRTILVIRDDDRVLLRRRPSEGLLAGLYEFPNESGWLGEEEAVEKAREYGCEPLRIRSLPDAKHIFTHKEWLMHGYEIRIGSFPETTIKKKKANNKAINKEANSNQSDGGKDSGEAGISPGQCFITTIGDMQAKYALPSAYAAYCPE